MAKSSLPLRFVSSKKDNNSGYWYFYQRVRDENGDLKEVTFPCRNKDGSVPFNRRDQREQVAKWFGPLAKHFKIPEAMEPSHRRGYQVLSDYKNKGGITKHGYHAVNERTTVIRDGKRHKSQNWVTSITRTAIGLITVPKISSYGPPNSRRVNVPWTSWCGPPK